jgi:hypothetical protein
MIDETTGTISVETDAGSSSAEVETAASGTEVSTEVGTEETQTDTGQETSTEQTQTEETQVAESEAEQKLERELSEWAGSAAARLRELVKAGVLNEKALTANPKLRDSMAAAFKRDAALRDRDVTIAEIDEYRARCVNGIQDLEAMERSLQEANQLDQAFFERDREGNYPRHGDFLRNLASEDREATIALLRRTPKDWAALDPESYSETFGSIMSSTFAKDGVADLAADLYDRAKQADDQDGMKLASKLWNYFQSFGKKQSRAADPETERLRGQLSARDQQDAERARQDGERFTTTLRSEASRNHRAIVNEHDLIKGLPQAISKEKRARIVDEVCGRIAEHLKKSYAFARDIRAAYQKQDTAEWHKVDRAGWKPWIVNMYVRRVLNEETPGIIQGNRTANATKRAAGARADVGTRRPGNAPSKPGAPRERTEPNDYTWEEIRDGKVPQHVLDAYAAKHGG